MVFEMGRDVERFEVGDIVSVPFNISCGKCDNDREGKTNACLRANKKMPGGAYGHDTKNSKEEADRGETSEPSCAFHLLLPCSLFPRSASYALMGGWQGGQAEYVLIPWADHQLIKLPKEVAIQKMTSLAFLTGRQSSTAQAESEKCSRCAQQRRTHLALHYLCFLAF